MEKQRHIVMWKNIKITSQSKNIVNSIGLGGLFKHHLILRRFHFVQPEPANKNTNGPYTVTYRAAALVRVSHLN